MGTMEQPRLLQAHDIPQGDIGTCVWDSVHNSDLLTVSNNATTVHWGPRKPAYRRPPSASVGAREHASLVT
jgi:hypothetical protein